MGMPTDTGRTVRRYCCWTGARNHDCRANPDRRCSSCHAGKMPPPQLTASARTPNGLDGPGAMVSSMPSDQSLCGLYQMGAGSLYESVKSPLGVA